MSSFITGACRHATGECATIISKLVVSDCSLLRAYGLITIVPQNRNTGWLTKNMESVMENGTYGASQKKTATESVTEYMIYTASWKSVTESIMIFATLMRVTLVRVQSPHQLTFNLALTLMWAWQCEHGLSSGRGQSGSWPRGHVTTNPNPNPNVGVAVGTNHRWLFAYDASRKNRHGKYDLRSVVEKRHGKRHLYVQRHENHHPSSVMEMRQGKRHGMCDVGIVKSLVWCKKIV